MARAHEKKGGSLGIPIAIAVAGALVAGAIFLSATGSSAAPDDGGIALHSAAGFRVPSAEDHVRGNPDAKIAIVEFSDFECPFCARLHPTLSRIVEDNPDVKWVYRHFPLSSIHSRALGASVASECIAKLGGNDAFWTFADSAFANQRELGASFYERLAGEAGIDPAAFRSCLSDRSIASEVARDGDEAVRSGGRGTPFAVIVTASGQLAPFSGALPYEYLTALVSQALTN